MESSERNKEKELDEQTREESDMREEWWTLALVIDNDIHPCHNDGIWVDLAIHNLEQKVKAGAEKYAKRSVEEGVDERWKMEADVEVNFSI